MVAVDPSVSGHAGSDLCGIVVVGARTSGPVADWRAVVLEDASLRAASPSDWARAAIAAMHRHKADRLVAEVNQGGDLVAAVLRQIDPLVPVRKVHAAKGKMARAEPVAALYEQGRVKHLRGLAALEEQMARRGKVVGTGSQGWRSWPLEYRHPDSPSVKQAAIRQS